MERHIYIWSTSFNKFPNEFLFSYLAKRKITNAIVSYGYLTNKRKFREFCEQAMGSKLKISPMFSDSKWILPDYSTQVAAGVRSILALLPKTNGIHLDIEPQTLPEWDWKRDQYLDYYLAMLNQIRVSLPNTAPLAASIPARYPMARLKEIAKDLSQTYVMAYGYRNLMAAIKSLNEELAVAPGKIVLSLQPTDFRIEASDDVGGESGIDEYLDRLEIDLTPFKSLNGLAIHDLARLMRFEESEKSNLSAKLAVKKE